MSDSESPPSTLYHYTNAAGLIGIIKRSSWDLGVDWPKLESMLDQAGHLLASDVRYMNDSQELKFGAGYFVARLKAAGSDSSLSDEVRQACARLAHIFSADDVFNWELRCFAACFCEHGDLLSQWRGYAGGAGGYAIGFSRDALAERSYAMAFSQLFQTDSPEKADLEPVGYGAVSAAAAADKFIERIRNPDDHMRLMLNAPPSMRGQVLEGLASLVLRAIVNVKDDGFQEEREWRLYYVGDPDHPVKIRTGRPGIVPFVHMAVNMKTLNQKTDPPTINEVPPTINQLVVGPGHNQRSQIAAARELLKACGHNPEVVVPSKISFTG